MNYFGNINAAKLQQVGHVQPKDDTQIPKRYLREDQKGEDR